MLRLRRYLAVLIVACVLVAFCNDVSYNTNQLAEGAALLLTAHPDDECMFFAPTILSLIQSSIILYSLCLSVGDADGLGHTREKEFVQSLHALGIPSERSQIVNHPLLQDNFTQEWRPDIIVQVVKPFIVAHNITTILTFDNHGVSQHPNHISLPNGMTHLLGGSSAPPATLLTLKTVPLLRKYIGMTSNPITKLWLSLPWTSKHPTYIAGFASYLSAVKAMYQHQSQLVWFRWLYVLFSQYMWINEWIEVEIPGDGQAMYIQE